MGGMCYDLDPKKPSGAEVSSCPPESMLPQLRALAAIIVDLAEIERGREHECPASPNDSQSQPQCPKESSTSASVPTNKSKA